MHHRFDLMHQGKPLTTIDLLVPGKHNVLNAVAACICGLLAGVPAEKLNLGMKDFHGACRRFEVLYHNHDIVVADDYATILPRFRLPFLRQRNLVLPGSLRCTSPLPTPALPAFWMTLPGFCKLRTTWCSARLLGSREKNTIGIYAKDLAEKIPGCVWYPTFDEMSDHVLSMVQPGDLVITMGCGDVNKCAHQIVEKLKKKFGD